VSRTLRKCVCVLFLCLCINAAAVESRRLSFLCWGLGMQMQVFEMLSDKQSEGEQMVRLEMERKRKEEVNSSERGRQPRQQRGARKLLQGMDCHFFPAAPLVSLSLSLSLFSLLSDKAGRQASRQARQALTPALCSRAKKKEALDQLSPCRAVGGMHVSGRRSLGVVGRRLLAVRIDLLCTAFLSLAGS
jgi:hypothetical protein